MNKTSKIISGITLMLFGIGWALETAGVINISFKGWWTAFIIIPSVATFFSYENKGTSLAGIGTGILLLLATRGTIAWEDFWKYILCMIAVIWGITLIFNHKKTFHTIAGKKGTKDFRQVNVDGREISQINTSFGKQHFDFSGQDFEGANVKTNFGFVALDLRNSNIRDGAVIDIDCQFGGMEIRVDKGVMVIQEIATTFAGVENNCCAAREEGDKVIYLKGECQFGGIEIK